MPPTIKKLPSIETRPKVSDLKASMNALLTKQEDNKLSPEEKGKLETLQWVLGYEEEPNYE